ncbi:MAG: LysR family transcriptional regulator [Hyphomicrobiales bacterium]|nr:LysR family transcriptional regulator [Hyphomicrobiales bacterium]
MAGDHKLNAYLYFEAVARRGAINRAAEELSVSPSAVSQQIKLLEQQMGVRLFRKAGRKLSLTLEGEQLFQASSTAMRILRDARQSLGASKTSRRLSLRVAPSFGVRWLGPRLSQFIAENPGWDLRIDAAPDPTNFDLEIMDLDIRYGLGTWQGLFAAPLTSDYVLPLCSPDYRKKLEAPGHDVWRTAKLIDSARALCQWDSWLTRNGITARNEKAILMDRSSMAIQLALDGTGVVLESLAVASQEVLSKTLVPLCPSIPVVAFEAYWPICPTRHLSRKAVRVFREWLDGAVRKHEEEVGEMLAMHGMTVDRIDAPVELAVRASNTR